MYTPHEVLAFTYGVKIWTCASPWQKETLDDISTLITCLICNLRTRDRFEIKSGDQVEDVTCQLRRSWGMPSVTYNFIPSGSWTKGRDQFFPCESWSVNYQWYWEIAIWSCADTLYFRLRAEKMFCMKILLILSKFHEKTLSRPGDIKIFVQGGGCTCTLSPIYRRNVKRRKTKNEMGGNIPCWNFLGGNFPGGGFSREEFDGWEFPRGEFS